MNPKGKFLSDISLVTLKYFINSGDQEGHVFELWNQAL
jgi:hypothetical protein